MPCFHPLNAWRPIETSRADGVRTIYFKHPSAYSNNMEAIKLPCGRCIGCKLAKSREWSVRCMHEADQHWENSWLTLTLNDDYLYTRPNPYSVQKGPKSEITRFIKRLRKKFGEGIRYLYCAEYGETCFFCNKSEKICKSTGCGEYYPWRGRPHYHVCLFNHDFSDKRHYKTINGCHHYTSETLDQLWTDPKSGLFMGYATISDLTPDSAAYTARYSLKKITGDLADQSHPITRIKHYERISSEGEIISLVPEYINMSRRPGIGKNWIQQYSKEVLDNDGVLFKQLRIKPPRYYDKQLEIIDIETFEQNKIIRVDKAQNNPDNHPDRLATREMITKVRTQSLTRKEI